MFQLLAPVLIVGYLLPSPVLPPGVHLAYRPKVGQVASYRADFRVTGEQVSLNERLAVKVQAQVEVREEVIAQEPDGSSRVRVSGRLTKAQDASGTFGVGQHGDWPEVEVRVSSRGEVVEARAQTGAAHTGPLQRAFAELLKSPVSAVLPERPVAVGDGWRWEADGAWQSNRLVGIADGQPPTADILSSGREPIALEETSEALGVTTRVSGEQRQTCHVTLLLPQGVLSSARGEMQIQTRGETVLQLVDGARQLPTRSDLRVAFSIRLISLDGEAIGSH